MNSTFRKRILTCFLFAPGIMLIQRLSVLGQDDAGPRSAWTIADMDINPYPTIIVIKEDLNKNKVDTGAKDLAQQLAKELESIGINMDSKRLDSLTDAITKGGRAAMAVATMLVISIAELNPPSNSSGNRPVSKTRKSLQPSQVNILLDSLNKGNRANLELARYLNPRLTQLKKAKPN